MPSTSPTAQRREVGALLRAHRERAGLKAVDAARRAGISAAKLSRLERGLRGLQLADVQTLCTLYGLGEEVTLALLASTQASREPGWWEGYSSLDAEAPLYYGLEAVAIAIESFQALVLPGLLQTSAYAAALLAGVRPAGEIPPDAVTQRVAARRQRQEVLRAGGGRRFHFVLDEAALRRRVGSPAVMVEQFDLLLTVAALPDVTIQVVPFGAGAHPGLDGSFTIHGFDRERQQRDAVFVEGLAGNLIIDNPTDVTAYRSVFEVLTRVALDRESSRRFLTEALEEWRSA